MITVTVDGKTLMAADPGEWRQTPPDLDTLKLAAAGKPEPWLQLVMMTIAQAATRNLAGQPTVDTTIAVTTRTDGCNVTYTEA